MKRSLKNSFAYYYYYFHMMDLPAFSCKIIVNLLRKHNWPKNSTQRKRILDYHCMFKINCFIKYKLRERCTFVHVYLDECGLVNKILIRQ